MERRGRIREVAGGADAARVPPHDLDAERAVVGAMLVSEAAVASVAESLSAEDFYSETHRVLYRSMMRLYAKGEPIDQLTLLDELRSVDEADRVGGRAYIFQLVESVPTAANAARYAEIVRGKALLRAIIDAGSRIADDAFREPEDVNEALDAAEQLVYNVSNRTLRERLAPVSELAPGALELIQRLYESEGEVTGVETGFEDLDRLTTGFHKSDLVVLAARPAMGKCLSAEAEIAQEDGSISTIQQVVEQRNSRLLTLGNDLKFSWTRPSDFVDDGIKPVFEVTTRLGRKIKTTITHPFLTVGGWRKLGELSVGDHVAVPRRMPVFGNEPLGAQRIKLLAYMIGDGGLINPSPRFTNTNRAIREDFARAVEAFGGLGVREETSGGTRAPSLCVSADRAVVRRHRTEFARVLDGALRRTPQPAAKIARRVEVSPASPTHWRRGKTVPDPNTSGRLREVLAEDGVALEVSNLEDARKNVPNGLMRWMERLGLRGCLAKDKFVPEVVFRAPREELAAFLNRLFATDGWATVLATGQAQLGYSTASEKLARQVQHLLLRFGVVAALRGRSVKYGDSRRRAYQLNITEAESIRNFVDDIGIFGKEAAVQGVIRALERKRPHANRDLIPHEAWRLVDEALSRSRTASFAEALGDRRLQSMAESDVYWDEIVSIESLGNQQVYDLTIPETHNFVANDICVHNTAFALNSIWHAAGVDGSPVAIFSLEMSKEQLVQRLISQTTRIPTQDLRSGNVRAEDWPKLVRGVAEVSRAPIWIDDTAGITLMEMRAKVRRLASRLNAQEEKPLSLVVVDYLQLMIGQGNYRENRQQEIAEISRGLKVLARDLDVPVLAIAQLSRAVEQRHDKRPLLSDLRDCLPGSALVTDADSGLRLRVDHIASRNARPNVWSVGHDMKLHKRPVKDIWETGEKVIYEVRTRQGRVLRASGGHRVMLDTGWTKVEDMKPGDHVASPRQLPEPTKATRMEADRALLLGWLLGDGWLGGTPTLTVATRDEAEVAAALGRDSFGLRPAIKPERAGNAEALKVVFTTGRLCGAGKNQMTSWLRDIGAWGHTGSGKHIPAGVFGWSNEAIIALLRGLFHADGSFSQRISRSSVRLATVSERLARDVQELLIRLRIRSSIQKLDHAASGYETKNSRSYVVYLGERSEVSAFLERVGFLGAKHEKAISSFASEKRNDAGSIDRLPLSVNARGGELRAQRGLSHSDGGWREQGEKMSRSTAAVVAERLDLGWLGELADSDLTWDEVTEVTPCGKEKTYDLTVGDLHNFYVDGLITHNSGAIEQDADMVMFLYRDEYYNPDSDDKGIAEVIVGKHRNGPTGKTQLAWLEQYTKFASLARRT
ncbi:MAG: replicative DNA helicase [Rubrobacteraceae bacterium]